MARNIVGQVLGGSPKTGLTAETVQDVFTQLNLSGPYTATIQGEPAELSDSVDDYDQIHFAPSVKGGK